MLSIIVGFLRVYVGNHSPAAVTLGLQYLISKMVKR